MSAIRKTIEIVKQDVSNIFKASSALPDPLRQSHIFITGGTGFLGTWLLELIAALNDDFDFKIRVSIASRSLEQFSHKAPHLFGRKDFTFIDSDIRFMVELPHDVTHIIHAAATSNKNLFSTLPTASFENNVDSTMHIMRLALQLGCIQNILLLSSSLVYGRQPENVTSLHEHSFGGTLPPFDINSIYAESKRACESAAAAFLTEMKLPISIARPFSFVGPYQSLAYPWAVSDFMQEALKGGPIKLMSDGSVVRSVMYASDFANWILHIAAYAKPRDVYNVGSPDAMDLLSIARMVRSYFKNEPQILTSLGNNASRSSNRRVVPCVDKAEKELQLKTTVNTETAIQRAMEWHSMVVGKQ